MPRARVYFYLIGLVVFALSLSSCSVLGTQDRPEVDLHDIFPEDLSVDQVKRLDVDGDDDKEWLVFYHIDLVADDTEGSPLAGTVYRPVRDLDRRTPPRLIPALLWLPGQGYLCLYNCEAKMEDAISAVEGDELVVRDKRDDESKDVVGVAIFTWDDDLQARSGLEVGGFVPLGHFRADSIELEKDQVTVVHRQNDRSNLATEEVYQPQDGHYYRESVIDVYEPGSGLGSPRSAKVIFLPGPPEKPADVKQPEKLVLALYHNYRDTQQIKNFFTTEAWDTFGRECANGQCGCVFERGDVSRVIVKQIAYEGNPGTVARVVAQVICFNGDQPVMRTVTWTARQQADSTWRLAQVDPGGDYYLCPRSGCPRLESKE